MRARDVRFGVATTVDEAELKQWLKERGEKDDRLYAQYGRGLEPEHNGNA